MTESARGPVPILYLNHDMTAGGAERALLNLLGRLDRARFRPEVWVRRAVGDLRGRYESLGIDVCEEPQLMQDGARRRLVWLLPLAAAKLRRFSIVHSFCSNAWWTEPWAVRLAGVKGYVIRKSDLYLHGPARSWELRHDAADRIVAVTENVRRTFYAGTPLARKARVIRNGVDTGLFRPLPRDPGLRAELGIREGEGLFACVANLSPYKGQLHLLIALALAKARGVPIHVAFAGRDLAAGEMQRWASELGVEDRAHFLGLVEDVPRLLSGCDGMVLVSPREGCSNAVLEAMACGVPVVLTAAGAEELIRDGTDGWVIPAGRVELLVERLAALAADREAGRRMGRSARQRAEQEFSVDRMARAYEGLYEELLEEKGA